MEIICDYLMALFVLAFIIFVVSAFYQAALTDDPLRGLVPREIRNSSKLWIRIKQILRVLLELWRPCAAVLFIPFLICLCRDFSLDNETVLVYSGVILQLIGILIVLHQVSKLRKAFEQPNLSGMILAWFERLKNAITGPRIHTGAMSASIGLKFGGSARATFVARPNPQDDFDEQINTVMRNIDELHNQISISENRSMKEIRKIKSVIGTARRRFLAAPNSPQVMRLMAIRYSAWIAPPNIAF